MAGGILALCFSRSLLALTKFAAGSELYSYILLIPPISALLAWRQRDLLPPAGPPARGLAAILAAAGALLLALRWFAFPSGTIPATADALALEAAAFVSLFLALAWYFLGARLGRALAFPLVFLGFITPLPDAWVNPVENFLQHGSAVSALGFFKIAGTPVFYHDLIFQLPGFNLRVAPECSGIHSSLVLLLVSLLAGHLFLRTPWKRAVLAGAVVPLALLRNGFRIFTIGELCVHISPDMIDSFIHRRGGPVFFLLSLLPFFLLLWLLLRSERPRIAAGSLPHSFPT